MGEEMNNTAGRIKISELKAMYESQAVSEEDIENIKRGITDDNIPHRMTRLFMIRVKMLDYNLIFDGKSGKWEDISEKAEEGSP